MSQTHIDTLSTRFLTAHGISYTVHDYEYVSDPRKIGIQAAAGIGIDQEKVFKTLDIGQNQIIIIGITGDKTAADARHLFLDRYAGSHQ